jgi:hypothetical protein
MRSATNAHSGHLSGQNLERPAGRSAKAPSGSEDSFAGILLAMQDDPVRYFQTLTENYRQMSDSELLDLGGRPEQLTEVAQQALRDEMKLRKLNVRFESPVPSGSIPVPYHGNEDGIMRDGAGTQGSLGEEEPGAAEYTWKTLLRDCESNDQAGQLREVLMRHGIESWVRTVPAQTIDVMGPQIYVAADQLEQAQAIAALPIPQDILDDWNAVVPEFELPRCPKCGKTDAVALDGTDPVNTWFCEACEVEWTDPRPLAEGATGESSVPS